ncbi:Uncharacterised protein [Cedecea neteri]|uniref:YjcB-like protein n=1 Tax=Cedecea neteri TaxID=158822 RepID=A0A291E3Q1_9ENTR|nr:YjcB family protein [Cedecea neteri]ATF94667.1 hypothetical protein CO704_22530 [Cedecea neteri]SQA98182.1 Uncharacterised protein [Cedecea neteri]
MATITTGVMLMRWPLFSAVLMFLASSLNIQFRRSDYRALAVISSGLGIAASCWFAMGLLGLTLGDFPVIWASFKTGLVEIIARMPPEWPTMMP